MITIRSPLSGRRVLPEGLRSGAEVLLSGEVFTIRDMSLARLMSRPGVLDLSGAAVYFCAPTRGAVRPKRAISCGPTTTARMAPGIPFLLRRGARIFIGKGPVPAEFLRALSEAGAVYLSAVGGCGAYYARFLKNSRPVAFKDLGPEAVISLEVENMPLMVAADGRRDIFYKE